MARIVCRIIKEAKRQLCPTQKTKEKRHFFQANEETEENASEAHQILHTVVLFKYMVFFIVRSPTVLSCDNFCINT
jgi:hypothetical protein